MHLQCKGYGKKDCLTICTATYGAVKPLRPAQICICSCNAIPGPTRVKENIFY